MLTGLPRHPDPKDADSSGWCIDALTKAPRGAAPAGTSATPRVAWSHEHRARSTVATVPSRKMSLMEYESEGVFWIHDEAEAVRGRLTFTESDGGELRLEDLLFAGDGDVMASVPLIRGQTLDGIRLSLIDTFPTSMQIASPTMPVHPHKYFVNRVLIGIDEPDSRLQEVRLDLHRLLDF